MSDYPPANERHIADINRIAELEAENVELKETVRSAYIEGWVDGRNTTSVDGDPAYDWHGSDSRLELKELSDE